MQIKMLKTKRVMGEHAPADSVLDVPTDIGNRLIRWGCAQRAAYGAEPDKHDEILEAVGALDDRDWTGQGQPRLDSLEQLLGWKPSRQQVDAALAAAHGSD